MEKNNNTRRHFLSTAVAGAASAMMLPAMKVQADTLSAVTAGEKWPNRFFNLFTNEDGLADMREIPLNSATKRVSHYLIRHDAARVTIGGMEPNLLMDWHVANQPNLIIPMFGTLVVVLRDGRRFELVQGDILFAEDCTGSGHKSGAGPEGQFGISVQLDKSFCPVAGESYLSSLLREQ